MVVAERLVEGDVSVEAAGSDDGEFGDEVDFCLPHGAAPAEVGVRLAQAFA